MEIYLTLDYELAMGVTGSVQKCLITPIDELEKILNKYNIKITIFVDAAYLYRLYQLKEESDVINTDYQNVISQIRRLSVNGHDIQMHFHPQWIFSNFSDSKWNLDYVHYRLDQVPEDVLTPYFDASFELLNSLCVNRIVAFRAGGFSLESYKGFVNLFKRHGLRIDSSVLPGAYSDSNSQKYDYRCIPLKSAWFFSGSVCLEDMSGQLLEVPITTKKFNALKYYWLKRELQKKHNGAIRYGDGKGIGLIGSKLDLYIERFKKSLHKNVLWASIDGFLSEYLYQLYNESNNRENFVILGHPKSFTDKSIENFEKFVQTVGPEFFKVISSKIS